MKKIIVLFLIIIVSFSFSTASFGQGPGYAGKKFHLKYEMQYLMPHLDWTTTSLGNLFAVRGNNFQADYALSRLWSVGAGYSMGNLMEDDISFEKTQLRIRDLGLYFRRYNLMSGSIAPIGTYTQMGLHRVNMSSRVFTVDYLGKKTVLSDTAATPRNMFSLGIGRQVLLHKQGVTFHVGWTGAFSYEVGDFPADPDVVMDDFFNYFSFWFNMGVGMAL